MSRQRMHRLMALVACINDEQRRDGGEDQAAHDAPLRRKGILGVEAEKRRRPSRRRAATGSAPSTNGKVRRRCASTSPFSAEISASMCAMSSGIAFAEARKQSPAQTPAPKYEGRRRATMSAIAASQQTIQSVSLRNSILFG